MSWGYKVLLMYLVFVSGILWMVFRSSSQRFDLVTDNYYARELKYQDKIDEMSRVSALSAPVQCAYRNNSVVIEFPDDFEGKKLTGEALLYRPSDERKDIRQQFSVVDGTLIIPMPKGATGLYELHLSWQEGTVNYYFEKRIII
jgi:nitrogen fixation protein FixH